MASLEEVLKLNLIGPGDLVAVSNNYFFSKLIRLWTKETYSHVGIVYRIMDKETTVAEAYEGTGVRFLTIKKLLPCYVFNVDGFLSEEAEEFIKKQISNKYSWRDYLRAALRMKPKKDDKWQCAEFANAVLIKDGLNICPKAITPGSLVREVLEKGSGRSIYIDRIK